MASISDQRSLRAISRSDSSSSHGHNSPLQGTSTPLSPVQLHRGSPVQERDLPANMERIEDGSEAQPSLSSHRAPSDPNRIPEEKDARFTSLRRATHWKTVGMIIGFLFAALLSALGHYLLFRNLDGKFTDTSYLTQPQTSAISILLTTMFKAALTASVGFCFAQHLWLVVRGNAIPLNTIEKLFTLRTNVLALCDLQSIWRAPLLMLMALFVWCLGIATIYPPGALIVTFEAYTLTENTTVSVMNPPIPRNLDFAGNDSFPTLAHGVFNFEGGLIQVNATSIGPGRSATYRQVYRSVIYAFFSANLVSGPTPALSSIARSIIIDNHVFNLPRHTGENSTYQLQFRGPQLRCDVLRYSSSIPLEYEEMSGSDGFYYDNEFVGEKINSLTATVFDSAWLNDSLSLSVKNHNVSSFSILHSDQNATSYEGHVDTIELSCGPKSVLYDVNVTFPRGVQKLELYLSDEKEMSKKWKEEWDGQPWSYTWATMSLAFPAEQQDARDYNQKVLDMLPVFNQWALLDALGVLLDGVYREQWGGWNFSSCVPRASPENGVMIQDCEDVGRLRSCPEVETPLWGTVFQPARFNAKVPQDCYDPRQELNITEAILNDVLTNITLSAISLGTWWEKVPTNTTRYESTYSFANPLNLVLPYSICFAAATAFAAIAIWSLSRNGTPAADGGFLQIMTATRGNTEMERLVLREKLTTVENMSVELKALKVRYGELVGEDVVGVDGRTVGFGTVEETVSLRKRK